MVRQPLDSALSLSFSWQLGPYVLLTTAEVPVGTTNLDVVTQGGRQWYRR